MGRFVNRFTGGGLSLFLIGVGIDMLLPFAVTEKLWAYVFGTALIITGLIIGIYGINKGGKPDYRKTQNKVLLDKSYTKILELLPKMKVRLNGRPYKVDKKRIRKATFLSISQKMQNIKAGTTGKERSAYFIHLTRWMDYYNIKIADHINQDIVWKELSAELDKYTMPILDIELKNSIWAYIRFIIGMYYERVYDECDSLFLGIHIGEQNRDAINELRLNEASVYIAHQIKKLRAKNN